MELPPVEDMVSGIDLMGHVGWVDSVDSHFDDGTPTLGTPIPLEDKEVC